MFWFLSCTLHKFMWFFCSWNGLVRHLFIPWSSVTCVKICICLCNCVLCLRCKIWVMRYDYILAAWCTESFTCLTFYLFLWRDWRCFCLNCCLLSYFGCNLIPLSQLVKVWSKIENKKTLETVSLTHFSQKVNLYFVFKINLKNICERQSLNEMTLN